MGRPPKPIDATYGEFTKEIKAKRQEAEKAIVGTVGEDKLDNAPSTLDRKGKAIFKALVEDLKKSGLNINNLDFYLLEILANAIAVMQDAQAHIKKEGAVIIYTNKSGADNPTANPYVGIYQKYYAIFKDCSAKLGLSPSDRAKLALLKVNADAEKEDELLKVLRDDE